MVNKFPWLPKTKSLQLKNMVDVGKTVKKNTVLFSIMDCDIKELAAGAAKCSKSVEYKISKSMVVQVRASDGSCSETTMSNAVKDAGSTSVYGYHSFPPGVMPPKLQGLSATPLYLQSAGDMNGDILAKCQSQMGGPVQLQWVFEVAAAEKMLKPLGICLVLSSGCRLGAKESRTI